MTDPMATPTQPAPHGPATPSEWLCRHGKYRSEHWCDDHIDHERAVLAAQACEPTPDDETLREAVAAKVHEGWMDAKRAQGVTSRPSEWGEEQMVPYADLSERAKDLDRVTVLAVLAALTAVQARPEAPDSSAMERIADALHETGICGRQSGTCYGACGKAAVAVAAALRGAR